MKYEVRELVLSSSFPRKQASSKDEMKDARKAQITRPHSSIEAEATSYSSSRYARCRNYQRMQNYFTFLPTLSQCMGVVGSILLAALTASPNARALPNAPPSPGFARVNSSRTDVGKEEVLARNRAEDEDEKRRPCFLLVRYVDVQLTKDVAFLI